MLSFTGTNNVINNSVNSSGGGYSNGKGGAIYTYIDSVLTFDGINNFIGNSADSDGGAICAKTNISLTFIKISDFSNNTAGFGGAIYAETNTLLILTETSDFSTNAAEIAGGAIFIHDNIELTFNGTNSFTRNSACLDGGAIFAETNISLSFTGNSSFFSNSAMQGGAISANRNSTVIFNGNICFTNNGNDKSILYIDNSDSFGGAVYLSTISTLSTSPHTTVYWENNYANLGGAIYVHDINPSIYCTRIATYIPREKCFFQLPGQNPSSSLDVQFIFKNNSADVAGCVLYGGAIHHCKLNGLDPYNSGQVFDMLTYANDTIYKNTSNISSDPLRVCLCKNSTPDCSRSYTQYYGAPYPAW